MSHTCVDLDSHGVVVDWQRHLQQHNCDCSGSFGVIYPGKLRDGSDVVVKFSATTLHNQSQDTLNDTLRFEAELLRQLHLTPGNPPPVRDLPQHVIKLLFFCDYCSSLETLYDKNESFRQEWIDKHGTSSEPRPGRLCFLVMPKMYSKNLAVLQRSVGAKYARDVYAGMNERVLWSVAGQLLQAVGFLNKHGFAHLDIKRENIVLEPINEATDEHTFEQLFAPLQCTNQAAGNSHAAVDCSNIRVHLIDFGHAAHTLHMLHSCPNIQKSGEISSLAEHCPKGYSAPEATRVKSPQLCLASDLFSLGCCLYMLSCGLHPFDTRDSTQILKDSKRQQLIWEEIQKIKTIDKGTLQQARFRNNYTAGFSRLSNEFQELILMILQPVPDFRLPPGDSHCDAPIARLFERFPQLFGPVSDEQKSSIVQNITPSTTQSLLLQLSRHLAEIRKSFTRYGEESKKRPREQSSGEMMETLIKLLNNLKDELKSVPGTPAIHLYSILDQVAALHDLLNSDGRWIEVEILLVCTLRQCQDCTKRNRGIVHQVCGCAFRKSHWLHHHIVSLVARNLRAPRPANSLDVMLDWLQFKQNSSFVNSDANTHARMEMMSIPNLLELFGLVNDGGRQISVVLDALLHRLKDVAGMCKAANCSSPHICCHLSEISLAFDFDCVKQLEGIIGLTEDTGVLPKILDVTSAAIANQPESPLKDTLAHLIASANETLLPLLSLLYMASAYFESDPVMDSSRKSDFNGLCQQACMLLSRLVALGRKPLQQRGCEGSAQPPAQTLEEARNALSAFWKHQISGSADPPDMISLLYQSFCVGRCNVLDESYPRMIASQVCRMLTVLSVLQSNEQQCSTHLAALDLKSIKSCLENIVFEWKRFWSQLAAAPYPDASAAANDAAARFTNNWAFTIKKQRGEISMGSFAEAACFCDCLLMHCDMECPSQFFRPSRAPTGNLQLHPMSLQLLWPSIFKPKHNQKLLLSDCIRDNKHEDALRLLQKTKHRALGWADELVSAIPRLWAKIFKHQVKAVFPWTDDMAVLRLKCMLKTIQVMFENPVCRSKLIGLGRSGRSGCCEHDVEIIKHSDGSNCRSCNAQQALHHLLTKCSDLIKTHFEKNSLPKHSLGIDLQQPLHVQYWFQILALLCAHSEFFFRPEHLDGNSSGIDGENGKKILFAAGKLFEIVELCAAPQLTIGGGCGDESDIKRNILKHLGGDCWPLSSVSQDDKHFVASVVLAELGRLAPHPLKQGSTYLNQAEDLHYILGELIKMSRSGTAEADARTNILRKVRAWNCPPDARGCSLYSACLCLMMLGRESCASMFGGNIEINTRPFVLNRLKALLDSIAMQCTADRSRLVEMFLSELLLYISLSSCRDELVRVSQTSQKKSDMDAGNMDAGTCQTLGATFNQRLMTLPAVCSRDLALLHQMCAANRAPFLDLQNSDKLPKSLESARQIILNILAEKADGQCIEELQVSYRETIESKTVERLFVENGGWVDQNVFINVWNRKWNAKQEQTLNSFLDLVKQHNRPILNVLTAAAQAANSAAASGAKSSFELNGETEKLIGKDDRLKMSHYQALAEQGCLEPGHPQIRWMREAFDVQALASKLERDSLVQLQEAVDSYITRRQKAIGDNPRAENGLDALYLCVKDIQNASSDERKKSTACAAFIECDLVLKMRQQLQSDKLLPMLLERKDLDKIIEYSEQLEQCTRDDRRFMRLAIRPKLARKCSDDFWREAQRLCSAEVENRQSALLRWYPEPAQAPISQDAATSSRADAIKRFSHIFDRHSVVKNPMRSQKSVD